jgi:SAM-dependent methyltransferase
LVFVSPRPVAEAIARIYAADETHARARGHLEDFDSPLARLEARRVVRLLESRMVPGRLLEIGPGDGSVLHVARRHGWVVGGVELNPDQAAFIRDQLGIPCWPDLTDVEGQWDVVYHRDVLSHFHDPVSTFQAIHELLRPAGLHVFESGRGDFDRRFVSQLPSFQFPDHLFFFTPKSLELLFDRSGFELVATRSYSLIPQFAVERVVRRLRGGATRVDTTPATEPANRRGRIRSVARAALAIVRYGTLYGLGRIAPKSGRPQHMLVVARRR